MARLFDRIKNAAADGRVIIGVHAADRLRERHVTEWQAVSGLADAKLIRERPTTRPYPSIEAEQWLPDGTPMMAIWSWITPARFAKLVTVHYFDV